MITLPNGIRLSIRHIRPEDKPLLVEGLAHLSKESIYRRFLSPKARFSSGELRYLTELDGHDHVALVAVHADNPRKLAGVARFVRLGDDPEAAEAAIVVADELHGQGLGGILATELADEAAPRGILRFHASILGENVPAQKLLSRLGERLDSKIRERLGSQVCERAGLHRTLELAA